MQIDAFTQFLLTTNAGLLAGIIATLWNLSVTMATVKADVRNLKRHVFGEDTDD